MGLRVSRVGHPGGWRDNQWGWEMLPIETVITFFTASVLLALAPGPDNIFVLTQSALQGRSAGIAVMLGLCTGLVVHSAAVALGVAVIIQASAFAFSALKYLGAAYLLYLAYRAFMAPKSQIQRRESGSLQLFKLYRRGIIMNITNPKVSIFFLAFLPQFVDPANDTVALQIMSLGALFIAATILIFGTIALLAGTVGQFLTKSDRAQNVLNKVAGSVFLCLALKLIATKR